MSEGRFYGLPKVILPHEELPKGALDTDREKEETQRIIPENEIFDKSQKPNVEMKVEKKKKKEETSTSKERQETEEEYIIEEVEHIEQPVEEKKTTKTDTSSSFPKWRKGKPYQRKPRGPATEEQKQHLSEIRKKGMETRAKNNEERKKLGMTWKEYKELQKKRRQFKLASAINDSVPLSKPVIQKEIVPTFPFDYEKMSDMVANKIKNQPKPTVSKEKLLQVENKIREDERKKLEAQQKLRQKTYDYYSRLPPTDLSQPDYWKNMFGMQ